MELGVLSMLMLSISHIIGIIMGYDFINIMYLYNIHQNSYFYIYIFYLSKTHCNASTNSLAQAASQ